MSASSFERPATVAEHVPCRAASCESFSVGLRSMPYLADHGFHGMVVLPGSFYLEMARRADCELNPSARGTVLNATFLRPVILGAEDITLTLEAKQRGDRRTEYCFYEGRIDSEPAGSDEHARIARLDIERIPSSAEARADNAFSPDEFRSRSLAVLDAQQFYEALSQNGNHYGPSFQRLSRIWKQDRECLGRVFSGPQGQSAPGALDPSLVDALTQLLASFFIEEGRTFVLQSIGRMAVANDVLPETLWAHAALIPGGNGDQSSWVGNVRAFDDCGRQVLELSGVAFALLERVRADAETSATKCVVASNFTAEPIEEALAFWADHFSAPLDVQFAPHGQIFQQLLDRNSALRRNRDGVNVVLLFLEEWAVAERFAPTPRGGKGVEQYFGGRSTCVLPNGLEIVHLNRYETDYLYREIFEHQCYLKHGIRLKDGATVLDIGANIGLFSLFVMSRCTRPRIYAYEPAPAPYELLRANCRAYGEDARVFNLGVSDRPKSAALTFYEKSSLFSGFYADETKDREALEAVVGNVLNFETPMEGESLQRYIGELTADRLRHSTHECRMTSVSAIIREHAIDTIDLLKIDAEKSEWDILAGIEEDDWPKISQIAMEIHDPGGDAVERIERLLAAKGYRCAIDTERLLQRSGLFNVYATRDEADGDIAGTGASLAQDALRRNVLDFCAALAATMDERVAPLVLCLGPPSPRALEDAALRAALDDAERAVLEAAGALPNVSAIASSAALRRYPVKEYYDTHSHGLGRIPYTAECYAALGAAVFRALFNAKRRPYKVIVLDCDNTLWKGVCGEDGPSRIELTAPCRKLQEFMIEQVNAGMLLCLCSKNNEKDVLEVFDRRPDMMLKREHLVSWRINWESKSENIRSLARELGLGLESFIFIDDNPLDCADVRIKCPGVLVLQLPHDSERIPVFLEHGWAFDHSRLTAEDRRRTRMYRENAERQRFRDHACSLKEFIAGLELRIEIAEAAEAQLERISQLTFRTNQFNFTTVRRSERELRDFMKEENATCLAVRAADRFGDYGLVGVVLYQARADRYAVDTLLLSCRVLGKGVEHEILAHLGRRAVKDNKRFVELHYRETEKNEPVAQFIRTLGIRNVTPTASSWVLAAERAASAEYNPDEPVQYSDDASPSAAPSPAWHLSAADPCPALEAIAERLCTIEELMEAMERCRLKNDRSCALREVVQGTGLERQLLAIWRKVLGRPRIGLDDNFFEAGGTSLRAVQVIAAIRKALDRTISIVTLFECPTVRLLAAQLKAPSETTATLSEAALRGKRRRNVTKRRTA